MMVLPQTKWPVQAIETITIDTYQREDQAAKRLGDVRFLAMVISDSDLPPTLENALAILAKGRANKPLAWTVTAEELPGLWAEMVCE